MVGYLLLCTILFFLAYFAVISVSTIRTIEVVGSGLDVQIDEKKLPNTLLFFPSENIRRELLDENPILSDIQFKKKYPNTLVIIPVLRTAVAKLAGAERTVLLDQTGIVLADEGSPSPAIPLLVIPVAGLRIGQAISDPRVTQSLAFLTGVSAIHPVGKISAEADGSLRAKGDKLDILFTQLTDMTRTLTTLQTLLAGFRIKGTLPTSIDLRFDKPIIKF